MYHCDWSCTWFSRKKERKKERKRKFTWTSTFSAKFHFWVNYSFKIKYQHIILRFTDLYPGSAALFSAVIWEGTGKEGNGSEIPSRCPSPELLGAREPQKGLCGRKIRGRAAFMSGFPRSLKSRCWEGRLWLPNIPRVPFDTEWIRTSCNWWLNYTQLIPQLSSHVCFTPTGFT